MCNACVLYSALGGKIPSTQPEYPMLVSDGRKENRAGYFLGLLDSAQVDCLRQVQQGLEVPCPRPTLEELEEAEHAECS